MYFTLRIAMDVMFSILWGVWNTNDFMGNLGILGEFLFLTGLVELLPVSNYEALTFSLTETGYFDFLQPKRIIQQWV